MILLTTWTFLLILSLLSLQVLETSTQEIKMAHWFTRYEQALRVADQTLENVAKLRSPDCVIAKHARLTWLNHTKAWWNKHTCVYKKGPEQIYYAIESWEHNKTQTIKRITVAMFYLPEHRPLIIQGVYQNKRQRVWGQLHG